MRRVAVILALLIPVLMLSGRRAIPAGKRPVLLHVLPGGGYVASVAMPPGELAQGPIYYGMPPGVPVEPVHHQTPFLEEHIASVSESPETHPEPRSAAPAAGSLLIKRLSALSPTSGSSSVNEPSVGSQGEAIFQTGNWYAAISTDNGSTYSYISPYTTFPTSPAAFSAGFCCDQRVTQDPSRDLVLWYLQYIKTGSGPTDTNGVRIAVAKGASALASNTWMYHSITPADFGLPPGKWLDFPHMQVSSNYVYFTANVFDTNGFFATHSVIGRLPLQALSDNTSYTMDAFVTSSFYSPGPVNGATTTMYFGSVTGSNSLRVISWPESTTVPAVTSITGLATTNSGSFTCTGPDGLSPCGRSDTRMMTGWLTSSELGFMWNSGSGAGRPLPFVRSLVLDPSSLAVISQPDIWSTATAWLYPMIAVNARGHLGGEVSALGGLLYPTMYAIIRDDLSADPATSGWEIVSVQTGNRGTSSRWGDFSGVVAHEKHPNTWIAVGHVQEGGSGNSSSRPFSFWFMRPRDDVFPMNPSFNITMSKSSYTSGDTITATEFGPKNPSSSTATVTLRVWLKVPGFGDVDLINLTGFALPPSIDVNLGPLALLPVSATFPPKGAWEMNSKIISASGAVLAQDFNLFIVQ